MNKDVFGCTIATVEMGAWNLFLWAMGTSVNDMLQRVFLLLSILYLIWKWRRDAKRKDRDE